MTGLINTDIFSLNNYDFSLYCLPQFLTMIVIIALTVGILKREHFSQASLLFSFIAVCFSIWLFSDVTIMSSKNESVAYWWAKFQGVGVVSIPPAAYFFVLSITNKFKYFKNLAIIALIISTVFSFLIIFTDTYVKGVYSYPWGHYAKYHSLLSILFLVFFTLVLIMITYHFYSEIKNAKSKKQKDRFKHFLAIYLTAIIAVVDFLPAYGINIYPFGFITVSVFMIGLFILVNRYELMDISPGFAAHQIIETMNDSLLLMNKDGIIQFVNPAGIEFFNKPEEDIVGKHALQVIEDKTFSKNFNKIIKAGFVNDYEISYQRKGAASRFLSLSILAIKNGLRQPLAIVCIGRDRTEYKKAEDQMKKAYAVPKTIIEGMPVGIIVSDSEKKVRQINKTAMGLLGYRSEREIVNKPYRIKTLDSPQEPVEINSLETIRTTEEIVVTAKGKNISVLRTSLPIMIDEEKLLLDVFVDISERKELEKKLQEYKVYLEKLVQERTNELETANTQLLDEVGERKKIEEDLRNYIDDLEKFKKITVDRENKLKELKTEANELAKRLGRELPYTI